jgi:DNA-directed RNA polymerase specialized sigma24 family protein
MSARRREPGNAVSAVERETAPLAVGLGSFLAALYDSGRRALDRTGLSRADCDDLVQRAAMAILRRWPTYRADRGTVEGWVCGVALMELRVFRREQTTPLVLDADACMLVEAPDVEHRAARVELAGLLLDRLPAALGRVVVLHDLAGWTYREIAAIERISKSEAHDRHTQGMAALAAAAARLLER